MVNDTIEHQILFIGNTNTCEPHEVSLCDIHLYQIAFCYFFQASDQTENDNDFNL